VLAEGARMICGLENRCEYWSQYYKAKFQGSFVDPKDLICDICSGARVLEIGPGEGRQFDIASKTAREYSIADISQTVLQQDRYSSCRHRFLLQNYQLPEPVRFEVVHAWYVVHHVLNSELDEFMEFVYTCLEPGGNWMFNYNRGGDFPTIPHSDVQIVSSLENRFDIKELHNTAPHSVVVVAWRRP